MPMQWSGGFAETIGRGRHLQYREWQYLTSKNVLLNYYYYNLQGAASYAR